MKTKFVLAMLLCSSFVFAAGRMPAFEPARDGELLAGAIKYHGGFTSLELKLTSPSMVKYFRAAIPAFCKDVEVLSAATITEGVKDQAQLKNKEQVLFQVNGGNGQRISGLELTLNGPNNSECDIPIFLRDDATPTPIDPDPGIPGKGPNDIQVCNQTRYAVWVDFAKPYHGGYSNNGWYALRSGECKILMYQHRGELYAHASTTYDELTWSSNVAPVNLCTDNIHGKLVDASYCGFSGYRIRQFGRLALPVYPSMFVWNLSPY